MESRKRKEPPKSPSSKSAATAIGTTHRGLGIIKTARSGSTSSARNADPKSGTCIATAVHASTSTDASVTAAAATSVDINNTCRYSSAQRGQGSVSETLSTGSSDTPDGVTPGSTDGATDKHSSGSNVVVSGNDTPRKNVGISRTGSTEKSAGATSRAGAPRSSGTPRRSAAGSATASSALRDRTSGSTSRSSLTPRNAAARARNTPPAIKLTTPQSSGNARKPFLRSKSHSGATPETPGSAGHTPAANTLTVPGTSKSARNASVRSKSHSGETEKNGVSTAPTTSRVTPGSPGRGNAPRSPGTPPSRSTGGGRNASASSTSGSVGTPESAIGRASPRSARGSVTVRSAIGGASPGSAGSGSTTARSAIRNASPRSAGTSSRSPARSTSSPFGVSKVADSHSPRSAGDRSADTTNSASPRTPRSPRPSGGSAIATPTRSTGTTKPAGAASPSSAGAGTAWRSATTARPGIVRNTSVSVGTPPPSPRTAASPRSTGTTPASATCKSPRKERSTRGSASARSADGGTPRTDPGAGSCKRREINKSASKSPRDAVCGKPTGDDFGRGTRGKRSDNGADQGLKEVEFKLDIGKRRLPSPDVRKSQSVEKERPPEFVVKPRRQFVDDGQTAKFKVNFEGIPPPKLTWSKDGKPLQAGSKIKMYEEGGYHYLEVCNVTSKDSGIYVGKIQNAAGTDTASAELDVFEKPKLLSRGTPPPTLSSSLQDMDVVIGDRDVKLQCDVKGGGDDCNVTWYHNGKEIRPGRKHRCRFTKGQSASLVITQIDEEDGGVYECVISNPSGEVRSSCTVSTQEGEKFEPPVFTQELQDMEVEDGDKVELIVEVKGSQPIQVYWMHNNRQVTVDTPGCVLRAVDGVHSLTVPRASYQTAGEYVCEAYNEYGDTDTFCRIDVREVVDSPSPPEFLTRPKLVTVTEGSSATFTCRVKGHPLPEVTWERNGCKLSTDEKYKVSSQSDSFSLEVLTSRYTDAGHYICHVQNYAGSVSHTCSLIVTPKNDSTIAGNNINNGAAVAAAGGGPVNYRALLKPSRQRGEETASGITGRESDRPPRDSEARRFRDVLRHHRQASPPPSHPSSVTDHTTTIAATTTTTFTTTATTVSIPTTAATTFSYTSRRNSRETRSKSPPLVVPPPLPVTKVPTELIHEGGRVGGVKKNLYLFENRSSSSPDLSAATAAASRLTSATHCGDKRGDNQGTAREQRPCSPPAAQETRTFSPVQDRRSPPQEARSFSPALEHRSFSPPEERRSRTAQNRSFSPVAQEQRRAFSPDPDRRARTVSPSRGRNSGWGAAKDPAKARGGPHERSRHSPVRNTVDRKQSPLQEYLVTKRKSQQSEAAPSLAKDSIYSRNNRESSPFSAQRDSLRAEVSKLEPSKSDYKKDFTKSDFKSEPFKKDALESDLKPEPSKSDPKADSSGKIDYRSVLAKRHNKVDQNGNSKFTPHASAAESTSKPLWALRKDHPSEEKKYGHGKDILKTGNSSKIDFRSVLKKNQTSSETKPQETAAAVTRRGLAKDTTADVQSKPRDSRPALSKAKTWDEDKKRNGLSTNSGGGSKVTGDRFLSKALSKDVNSIKSKFENPAPESKDLTSIKSKFETPAPEFKSVQLKPTKPQPADQPSVSVVHPDAAAGKSSDWRATSRTRDANNTAAASSASSNNTPSTISDLPVSATSTAKYSDTPKYSDSSQCSDSAISSAFSKLSEFSDLSDTSYSPRSDNFPTPVAAAGVADLAEPSRSSRRRFERLRGGDNSVVNSSGSSSSVRSGGLGVVVGGGEERPDEEEEDEWSQAPNIERRLENQQVTYGGQAVFQCRVVGIPEPDIKWSINNKAIKQSRFFQLSYSENVAKLVVAEAFSEDEGEYKCTATNTAGTDSCSCYLTVEPSSSQSSRSGSHAFEGPVSIPPRVVTLHPKNRTVRLGEPVRVDVTFIGEPAPTVQWFKAKTEICSDDHFNIMNDACSSSLTISSTGANDGGRYTVTITNDLGTDLQAANIGVEDVPEPPVGLPHVYDISKRSVSLSWCGPAYDGGSMVTHYAIEVKDNHTQQWTTLVSDCQSMSYHVVGVMSPDKSYQFRVRAGNKLGLSEPSLATESVTMTDPLHCCEDYESDNELPFEPRDVKVSPGRKFEDHYEYLHEVGRGKFGNVYKCKDKATGKIWAAKVLKVREKDKENVRREVEVMNQLAHPKLLMLWDAFEAPRTMVLVMEYVGAGELFERVIRDDFVLTERDCVHFVRQICAGVGYMHSKSILHLDLKPENVLCVADNSNQVKIIDFGLARFFKPGDSLQVLFGTPEFIAPEVINYDAIAYSTDMWSIGVICYILLSGLSPFLGDNDAETLSNVTSGEFDFDDESFEDISDNAKDFIQHLLVKRKEKRNTIPQCEQHPWLTQENQRTDGKRLNTDRLRCFMARRKWQKAGNAFRALGRMASLQKMLTGGGGGSSSTASQSVTSSSSLSSIPDTPTPVATFSPSPSEDSPFAGGPRSGQATPTPVKAKPTHVQSPPTSVQAPPLKNGRTVPLTDSVSSPSSASPSSALKAADEVTGKEEKKEESESSVVAAATSTNRTADRAATTEVGLTSSQFKGENRLAEGGGRKPDRGEDIERSAASGQTTSPPSTRRKAWERDEDTPTNTSSSLDRAGLRLELRDTTSVKVSGFVEKADSSNLALRDRDPTTANSNTNNSNSSSSRQPRAIPTANTSNVTNNNANSINKHSHDELSPSHAQPRLANGDDEVSDKTDGSAPPPSSLAPPAFLKEMVDCSAFQGDVVRFDVHVTGQPAPQLTWSLEDEELEEDDRIIMELGDDGLCSLIVRNVTEDDEGEYSCRAFNSQGEATCSAELDVYGTGAV